MEQQMKRDTNVDEAAEVDVMDEDFEETDGSDLFDDEDTDSEETEETAEDEDLDDEDADSDEEDEPAEETKPGKKSNKPDTSVKNMLKVTHNGKEREIDPMSDEAKTLIQKGLNHDHLSAKLAERDKVLAEYGKINGGISADEALKILLTSVNAATEDRELTDLKTKYPDAPEEVLKELAKANASAKALTLKQSAAETETQKRMQELQADYPQYAKLEDLPKEVQTAIASGKTPLQAVKDYEITDLKAQVAKLQTDLDAAIQNKKNQDRALGSAKGTAGKTKKDAFSEGLGVR
jgi:uncharacterized protein YdcH (DUF465 family)